MRTTTFILVLTIVLASIAAVCVEQRHTVAHTGRYVVASSAGNGLNLRTGPSGDYRVLLTMGSGDAVKARGHRGNWMYVTHLRSGQTGWAWLSYLTPSTAPAAPSQPNLQLCWDTTWRWTACAPVWIAQEIAAAASYYGVSYWALMQTAACESAFDPYAENWEGVGVVGLFQFHPATFYAYGGVSLYSVHDQAMTAARMFSMGLAGHWACASRIGYIW